MSAESFVKSLENFRKAVEQTRAFMIAHAVDHVPGSLRAGTQISKVWCDSHDTHPIGARGRVVAVMPYAIEGEFGYFIEWDDLPNVPVFTRGKKVQACDA